MRKIILGLLVSATVVSFAQTLTLKNRSPCSSVQFNVIALDATTSCPPNKLAQVTIPVSGSDFVQDILDFDAAGAGPVYWTGGGTIGSSPWWGLYQGTAGPVGSPTFSSTCFPVGTSNSLEVYPTCTVTVTWSEDLAGNVTIQAN